MSTRGWELMLRDDKRLDVREAISASAIVMVELDINNELDDRGEPWEIEANLEETEPFQAAIEFELSKGCMKNVEPSLKL